MIQKLEPSKESLDHIKFYVEYLTEYICKFRCGNAYPNWSVDLIRDEVIHGLKHRTLLTALDPRFPDSPAGIVTSVLEEDEKILRITGMIIRPRSRGTGIICHWLERLKVKFPDFNIEGKRHGFNREWKTNQFLKGALKLGL